MVDLAHEGMTMMVVTHEMGFARKVANRVIFMDRGEIVEDAPKDNFFGKPRSDDARQGLTRFCRTRHCHSAPRRGRRLRWREIADLENPSPTIGRIWIPGSRYARPG